MKGVCAFDIDNTLTCGEECNMKKLEYIKKSISYCRDNNMTIVINTARPPQRNILGGIDEEIVKMIGKDVKVLVSKINEEVNNYKNN